MTAPVAPGGTIGILGGGQLGRMLALAAARLGLKIACLLPRRRRAGVSGFRLAIRSASSTMRPQSRKFAAELRCRHVRVRECSGRHRRTDRSSQARESGRKGIAHHPGSVRGEVLRHIAWPRRQPPSMRSSPRQRAREAFAALGGGGVLKTRRLGYDGKGQVKVSSADEAAAAIEVLQDRAVDSGGALSISRSRLRWSRRAAWMGASRPTIRRRMCTRITSCAAPSFPAA